MIVAVIVACEVGFWVLLSAGLLVRYGLRWRRVSAALLVSVPLVDLVLLVATAIDLRGGATATGAHGLAAAYLGFSIAFGHQLITNLDRWAAHRFADGPAPARPPRTGPGRVRHEWSQWRRAAIAWAVACALLMTAVLVVGDSARTAQLMTWTWWLTAALVLWLTAGPILAQIHRDERPRQHGAH
ncbi:MAG: hypothetical protein WKF57_07180 [Nakamurella sp.]